MKRFLYLLIVLILASCHKDVKESYEIAISTVFPDVDNLSVDYVVIIPNQGCGGCITYAEEFYKKYAGCNNIRYIFTNILSVKMLNLRLEINKNNTYLDSHNNVLKILPSKAKIYPSIVKIDSGKVIEVAYQSPEESGFSIINYNELHYE